MLATNDAEGRVVVPKQIRERLGLRPGTQVELTEVDGVLEAAPSVTPITVVERHGLVMREAYFTLTRLPEPLRISGPTASEALRRAWGSRIPTPSARLHEEVLDRLSRSLVVGGCAYDGLVALTSQEHGAQLVSLDRRAERTYRLLGVNDRILSSHLVDGRRLTIRCGRRLVCHSGVSSSSMTTTSPAWP